MPLRARVLLVDDDELSLELVAIMLEAEGYIVIRSESGAAGIEHLQKAAGKNLPDVLLLDLQMPGLSGTELAERCRALATPKTPILAMSASRPPASGLVGYDGFVSKPFSVAAFHRVLERVTAEPGSASFDQETGQSEVDLDKTVYDKLSAMMPAARLNEIYSTCLADTVRRIPVMKKSGAGGDLAEVRRIAHGIRGGSSMVGARRIAAIAGELELGDCSIEDVPRLLSELSSACERLGSILLLP